MEERAAAVFAGEHPAAIVSLSHNIGRLGLIERENGTIINAALAKLAAAVVASFQQALAVIGLAAPLYISQHDGTLILAAEAARNHVLDYGSGPTKRVPSATFLPVIANAISLVVEGTTG